MIWMPDKEHLLPEQARTWIPAEDKLCIDIRISCDCYYKVKTKQAWLLIRNQNKNWIT